MPWYTDTDERILGQADQSLRSKFDHCPLFYQFFKISIFQKKTGNHLHCFGKKVQKLNQSAELPSKRHNGREAFHELSESVDFVAESTSRPSTLVRPVEIAAKLAET